MATRTNLVTNPSFEVDLSSWTATEASSVPASLTATRSTTQAMTGGASLKLVQTTAGEDDFMAFTVSVATNTVYTLSAWYYLETYTAAALGTRGFLFFPNAGGVGGANITDTTTGKWIRLSDTINSLTSVNMQLRCYAPQGTIYWDAILVETGTNTRGYFDGSIPSSPGYTYAWTGTAHASTSTETSPSARLNNRGIRPHPFSPGLAR